ncbi:hypothetical protein PN36_10395 [Candidatus Thiomargarita nelsonii]|uniref:Uncharacterized protein n=1 Tax=Candidatus Thiomargarita nelsonii TaxID=1003181 RepID=A0A0A6P520_9GAMM|nr:hypothetical protein PN36_10395 [Candidatus Thiomargarita nelsonii]
MSLAYKKITINQIRKQFDITVVEEPVMFTHISAVEPSDMLRYFLKRLKLSGQKRQNLNLLSLQSFQNFEN